MRHCLFMRFSISALTFFGTKLFTSHEIFENNLHTYISALNLLYSRLLHYVGCLHEIEATYINRGIFGLKMPCDDINMLTSCLFRLT